MCRAPPQESNVPWRPLCDSSRKPCGSMGVARCTGCWLRSSDQHAMLNLRPWLSTHLQKMQLFSEPHSSFATSGGHHSPGESPMSSVFFAENRKNRKKFAGCFCIAISISMKKRFSCRPQQCLTPWSRCVQKILRLVAKPTAILLLPDAACLAGLGYASRGTAAQETLWMLMLLHSCGAGLFQAREDR